MEKIKKKKKKGAAMLIALLVFLLAALSGTVVLTMATSNAGRYTHTKEDQQAYLAVMSAAQAVKSEFESGIEASIEYVYENKSLKKAGEASVSAKYILRIGDSSLSATMGEVAVSVSLQLTTAQLDFDFYYTGNGSDNYHVSMQIGGGVGSEVVSVTYPPAASEEVRIKVQFPTGRRSKLFRKGERK